MRILGRYCLSSFQVVGVEGLVAAGCAGDDRAVEVCAEFGEDGFDATNRLA
jgi:hypothetical protein